MREKKVPEILRHKGTSPRRPIGEERVAEVLDGMGVEYVREATFKGLERSRFDFVVLPYNAVIEFDGEHHFHPIDSMGGEERFIDAQHRDYMKDVFCRKNGITYIRIAYWQFSQIEEIIARFIAKLENRPVEDAYKLFGRPVDRD